MKLPNHKLKRTIYIALIFINACTPIRDKEPAIDFSKMNILFINDEDLSRRAIGAYGHEDAITPYLDRLANEGMKFENVICQSPMCNPSRASFLTGLRPQQTKIFNNQDLMNEQSPAWATGLASILKPKGAFLGNIGKLYHGREKHSRYRDFDLLAYCKPPVDFEGLVIHRDNVPCSERQFIYSDNAVLEAELKRRKLVFDSMNQVLPQTNADWWFEVGIPYVGMQFQLLGNSGIPEECDEDYKKARLAGDILKEKSVSGEQFFLSVGFSKPHTPIRVPQKYMDMYKIANVQLPDNPRSKDQNMLAAAKRFGVGADIFTGWFDEQFPELSETHERRQKAITAYLASATFIDAQVGYLLDVLEETGLARNTIVIFMTDHGFHLAEHGLWSKYSVFDEVLRVPMLIKIPGVRSGTYHGLVELVDLLPTLCDMWGVEKPMYLEGESLLPIFHDTSKELKQAAFNVFDLSGVSGKQVKGYTIRTRRYRLTQWGEMGEHGVELFDFKTDPKENINVAGLEEYRSVKDSLLIYLRRHHQL